MRHVTYFMSLPALRLPHLRHPLNTDEDPERDTDLRQWQQDALNTVIKLQDLLVHNNVASFTDSDVASVVAITAPLAHEEQWITDSMCAIAKDIMLNLPAPTLQTITCVLFQHIKPLFAKTPHPSLNPESGRKLSRPAGGPFAAHDHYNDQIWKTFPGIANLLLWCVEHLKPNWDMRMQSEDYEHVWHLLIPPTMTLLDDYQSHYRLKGLIVVSALLDHVPPESLKRTGVDGLLVSSLRTTMIHLHSPLTPELLRRSVPILLRVIDLTTPVHSKQRFDLLCALLGDGIIGAVWIYAYEEWETLEASMIALPNIIQELGIGSIRYLKALIPQIVHNLTSLPPRQQTASLQLASLGALEVIIDISRVRIHKWKTPIVEGLAKAWTALHEVNSAQKYHQTELQSALRRVSRTLLQACPSVREVRSGYHLGLHQ
ncbi:hypothetical protein K439DRAFT_1553144 [Ramaria rubella]|nr:hypothetical protein K439DRAFT_1553144 [Ramaria rubella]